MSYVLQLPDTIEVEGENVQNGYIRLGSSEALCFVGVQLVDDVARIIARGPKVFRLNLRAGKDDAKRALLGDIITVLTAWKIQTLKELAVQDSLQDLLSAIRNRMEAA